jgi:hypothetical protein
MSVAAGTAFKFVRGENRRLEREMSEKTAAQTRLEQEVADLRSGQASTETVERLQRRVEEQDKELSLVRYESTPEYQAIQKSLDTATDGLKSIAKRYNIAEGELVSALSEKDPSKRSDALSELTKEFKAYDLVSFDRLSVERDARLNERESALSTAADRLKAHLQQQTEQARVKQEAFKTDWKRAIDSSLNTLRQKYPIFNPTGDAKWDGKIVEMVNGVRSLDMTKMSNDDMAMSLYRSEALPLMFEVVTTLMGDNSSLVETVGKLRGTTPPAGGGAAPDLTAGQAGPTGGASFMQVLRDKLPAILPR